MATDNDKRLVKAGPIDPSNGFPLWFEDEGGTRLEIGLMSDPFTPAIGELPDPAAPMQFPDNFPDESFYFMAEARLPVGGAGVVGRARVIMALEAAFGGAGEPRPGLNVVFARLRVRIDDVIPGETYVVTHPYGETAPLPADDGGRVFYTEDLGIVEGDPTAVMKTGRIAPFLAWVTEAPAGYLGDGASERQIKGSPFNTNFVRIVGPRIRQGGGNPDPAAPADINRVWTDLFSVQARLAQRLGAAVTAATYSLAVTPPVVRIQAISIPSQQLEFVADGLRVQMRDDGENYAAIASVPAVPPAAEVVNVSDVPPTRWRVVFTDQVVITSALHDVDAGTLTLSVRSSDPAAILTITELGLQVATNPQSFSGVTAAPARLTVTSSKGGSDRQTVELAGAPFPALGVEANAFVAAESFVGEEVLLDGSGSRGATVFQWQQTPAATVVLADANTAQARFTPDSADALTFVLTVQGAGGPKSATVNVTVSLPQPDTLAINQAEFRTRPREFRLSGTVGPLPNLVIARTGGFEIGRAAADATGAWSIRRTLLASELAMAPTPGATVEVSSKRAVAVSQLLIRN